MALNFPNSPSIGQIYIDSTSKFAYEWDGTVWKSFSEAVAGQISILDDISSSFDGIETIFPLTSSSTSVTPVTKQSLIINLGGVVQDPSDDYNISGTNIIFSTPPASGLTFSGVLLGSAYSAVRSEISSLDDTTTNSTFYPVIVSGTESDAKISTTKLSFNPSTGDLTATSFSGNLTGNSDTSTYATTAGVSTNAQGLIGSPNIVVGIATATTISVNSTSTFSGKLELYQFINEKINVVADSINNNLNIDLIDNGSVHWFTSNSTATWTPNFRGNSSTTLDSLMSVGQVTTVTVISSQNNSSYYSSSINVDGTSRTIKWSGGTAPTTGSSAGYDFYTYSIVKTASNTFTVFASQSQYN